MQKRVGSNPHPREAHGPLVAIGVIGMTVRVDYVRHGQALFRRARDKRVRRVRRINQDREPGRAISEKVSKVPIASGANLLEDKLHTVDCKGEAVGPWCFVPSTTAQGLARRFEARYTRRGSMEFTGASRPASDERQTKSTPA